MGQVPSEPTLTQGGRWAYVALAAAALGFFGNDKFFIFDSKSGPREGEERARARNNKLRSPRGLVTTGMGATTKEGERPGGQGPTNERAYSEGGKPDPKSALTPEIQISLWDKFPAADLNARRALGVCRVGDRDSGAGAS